MTLIGATEHQVEIRSHLMHLEDHAEAGWISVVAQWSVMAACLDVPHTLLQEVMVSEL